LSLGAITVLVSRLVSADVRITAEDNNFSLNQRIASAAEIALFGIRSKVLVLLNGLSAVGGGEQQGRFFFEQNPDIAAVGALGGAAADFLFLTAASPVFAPALLPSWVIGNEAAVKRALAGETLLCNAAPFFGAPVLVLLFPTGEPSSGGKAGCAAAFFLSKNLAQVLGAASAEASANVSFLVNDAGDVLVHPQEILVRAGTSLRDEALVQRAFESGDRSLQTLYTDGKGIEYFGSYRKLSIANSLVITQIQTKTVFAGVAATVRRNIITSGVVLLFSMLFIVLFSKTISKPVKALTRAAGLIEEGDYNLNLKVRRKDETGILTQSFIGMGLGLENFGRFTNKAIVKLARTGKLTRTGVNKTATISFCFIRDFSEMAEGMEAKETVEFVNQYLFRMVPCITRTGGVVDKFLTQGGVVVMALWGAAESAGSPEQDAIACVRSCLMMRASLCALNHERKKQGKPLIKMGCGINSGQVVAGQMGSDERMEYTVIGDAVNLAARIEGPNDLFDTDILITENTSDMIGRLLLTEEMDSIEVKGKEKPLRIFAVVNMADARETLTILNDLKTIPETDIVLSSRCIGPIGPKTMAEVRQRW
jgi:adenylate cyclase